MLTCRRFLISITIFLLLFFGCKSGTPQLTFAVGGASNEVEYWERIVAAFADSTKIDVVLLRQPTDTDQRRQGLVIPLRSRQPDPDVFLMDVIWVGQFAASDWLQPLDSMVATGDVNLADFFEPIVNQVDTYQDSLYALPVYNDCGLLYFRKDLLVKYGLKPPVTWQQLIQSADFVQKNERVTNPSFFGFVWQGAQYEGLVCNFLEFAASNNGGITDSAGRIIVYTPENIEAADLMYDLIHKHKISPPNTYTEMKEEETRLTFENGNALYERNWPYAWALHNKDGSRVRGKVAVALLPRGRKGQHAATLGGWHIGISKFSDSKAEAMMLLKFVLSYATQKKLALNLGWNPGRSDLYEDTDVRIRMPHLGVLKNAFEHAVARPTSPYYTQISEILQQNQNAALSGRSLSDEALAKAQREIDEILQRYNE
ncbi:MAG: ABC transporter substrate-binding protein [candidate division WOR-3 bacterium]|nr:MAG: ABC transporter substrate-binding protein [candidate division WOR-3 bacterium]